MSDLVILIDYLLSAQLIMKVKHSW